MTIFFSGHQFKYELEGIAKLFFPVERFNHIYDEIVLENEASFIITRRKEKSEKTLLWVSVSIEGVSKRKSASIPNNEPDYEKECERLLCVLLYEILSEITGKTPKWGILTGVRPVAVIQGKRKDGMTDDEIGNYLKEKYLVSDKKLDLAFLTADTQLPFLKSRKAKSYSLYVSIPFCVSRCSYCSFVSHAITTKKSTDKIDEYVELLEKEIEYTASLAEKNGLILDTIYIGGGTPTALSAQQLKRVTDAIQRSVDVKAAREYTIEAGRADTITREKLEVIKASGATRISVNPQTFNDSVLVEIGRKHTAKEAIDSFKTAREMGFDNINMDFIAGLPTDTLESFKNTIDTAVALGPENITVHTLSIKRSADLFQKNGIIEYAKSDVTSEMTDYANETLIKAGYNPYYLYRQKNTVGNLENVGYSKAGFESVYNIYIMDEIQTILACGAGGVTKLVRENVHNVQRVFNYKFHFEYIKDFDVILKRKEAVSDFYAE